MEKDLLTSHTMDRSVRSGTCRDYVVARSVKHIVNNMWRCLGEALESDITFDKERSRPNYEGAGTTMAPPPNTVVFRPFVHDMGDRGL
jgi:hypothetical protein